MGIFPETWVKTWDNMAQDGLGHQRRGSASGGQPEGGGWD